ncbi:MAG: SDR family oxidoreductase [Deltaproteobacteria bacterium]|nr:SDR family oxidoreductase [Deltaproteobacteria bacterium]
MTAKAFLVKDKIALIAGDSKLWTKPAAVALVEAGADVAIAAKDTPRLAEATEAVRKTGRKVLAIPTDVTKAAQVKTAVRRVVAEYGRIDILVNAGDVHFFQPFLKIRNAEWNKVMDYNFNSALSFCRAAGKQMLKQKKGRIINIVSGLSERGMVNGATYCVAMGSVLQLTRVLALEWAMKGITVNAVGTGWFAEADRPIDEAVARYIPVKRYGEPDEIGSLVVYLASDVTEFTTGQLMFVDGGVMAHA